MTVRRNDKGELEKVADGISTTSWRTILVILILSGNPIGRELIGTLGFHLPGDPAAEAAKNQLAGVSQQIKDINADIHELKDDTRMLKNSVASVEAKSERMEQRFAVFQVDFDKYRKEAK